MPPSPTKLIAAAFLAGFGVTAAPALAQGDTAPAARLLQGTEGWERLTQPLPEDWRTLRLAQADPTDARQTEADQLLEQGRQQFRVSQFRAALQSWQAALEIYRELGDQAGEGKTLNNIGLVYQNLGDYDYPQALDTYQQSLAITREIGDRATEGKTLNNIGSVHLLLGNYPQALDYYQQSLAITREIGDRATEAETLGNIGLVYDNLGDYPQALEYYQQSLAIIRDIGEAFGTSEALRVGEGATLDNIGIVHQNLGDYPQALDYHQQALAIFRDIGDRFAEAKTLFNLGSVSVSLNQDEQALAYYQQSLSIHQEIGDYAGQAFALWGIAQIDERSGDYSSALTTYQQGLAISREVGRQAEEAAILNRLGAVFEAQGQPELAIVFYKEAINTYELIRERNQALEQSLQTSYTETIEDIYRHLAQLLLQHDRILEAQRVLDLLKVQELDHYLRGVRTNTNTQAGAELAPPETVIASAHSDLIDRAIQNGKRLAELEDPSVTLTEADLDELGALQAEQRRILQAFNRFKDSELVQTQIALLSPEERSRHVQLGQLAALQDNLGQIPQGAVLLYPLILNDTLELVVTSPYAPPIHRTVHVSRPELNQAVHAFRYALEEPTRDAIAPAQKLYSWLIEPIAADLEAAGVNTVIYAPDRSLRYIPLAALHDGDRWLAERFRINHITAASLTDLNTRPNPQTSILAGALTEGPVTVTMGEDAFRFNLLEYADDEVEEIAALSPDATPLLDTDFNRDRIERDANRYTILHLATHAKFLVGSPEDSFILFSNRELWTLEDFKQGLFTLTRVDLVVLSACETGVDNTFGNGEEILGFGYLMQQAGARAAMASLWAVDDGGTQLLMTEFYDGLVRGDLSKVEALRQAQIALIRAGEAGDRGGFELANSEIAADTLSHPYYWAPFILIGNGL
ncbi:MAG: tetratricopeptide repeat protein [Pseudanabaenales cyanobacterium]|nr:tetratricopeptide repeat protein [Pseudanabaenales cyanobacterium]